jgi:hypothetical protein
VSSVVVVDWTDAAQADDWGSYEPGGLHVISAGMFVDETDDVLTIARDYDPDNDIWRGLLCIPKCLIRTRVNIERQG